MFELTSSHARGIVNVAASVGASSARASDVGKESFLIQDPCHEYAAHFIEQIHRRFGMRAICFYTDRRDRLRRARQFPVLESELVTASYEVSRSDLVRFVAHLREHHRVVGVVPANEPAVLPATELGELLGLSWAQPIAMRRVCDKFAFKRHLREQHPQIRINASRLVQTSRDVRVARHEPAYRRFVIKPNGGFGNRAVGLFDENTPEEVVRDFLYKMRGVPLVMEEFVDGEEYFVNGQVDAQGRVLCLAAFQYLRRPANGRHNLDFETLLLPHRDPRFAQLTRYAEEVVRASELKRTPFHLELKLDTQGPCLIELGARLVGHGNALLCGELHGAQLGNIRCRRGALRSRPREPARAHLRSPGSERCRGAANVSSLGQAADNRSDARAHRGQSHDALQPAAAGVKPGGARSGCDPGPHSAALEHVWRLA